MKYIDKGEEPHFFTEWKTNDKMCDHGNPKWDRLNSVIKTNLKEVLIIEQGSICCYCGVQIKTINCHIEHFRPKKKDKFPQLQLEYNNLLCSCQLEFQKKEPKHCGRAKGSWFEEALTISPLDHNCESRFKFLENGSIQPFNKNDEGAKKTISKLALDIEKLNELRQYYIAAVLDDIDIFEEDSIQETINIYSQRNPKDGKYMPFCFAVLDVLNDLLG